MSELPDGEFLPSMGLNCVEDYFKGEVAKNYNKSRHVISARCAHITENKDIFIKNAQYEQFKTLAMLLRRTLSLAFMVLFASSALMAQNFKYIGAAKCKMCHNKPDKGEQYNKWLEGPHANAM